MSRFRNNLIRKFHLYIVVDGKEMYAGFQYSIKEFLMVLSKWERVEGFEEAHMEVEESEED